MATKKILSEAAVEAALMKRDRQKSAELAQAEKEQLIAQCHELVGRIQASSMIAKFADVGSLMWLQQVKESRVYKSVPGMDSWARFCNYIGKSRSKVDEDLQNLQVLGTKLWTTVGSFGVGHKDLRKLRKSVGSGEVNVTSEALEIGGKKISFDDKENLEIAIENILEQKDVEIRQREKTATKKVKVAEEENKGLKVERDALVESNQQLQVFKKKPRTDEDLEWSKRQMIEIHKACNSFAGLCGKFIADERLEGDRQRQAEVEGIIEFAQLTLRDLYRSWVDQFIPDDGLHG